MTADEQHRRSGSDRPIERGETYSHARHGRVEVTDIWHGTRQVDSLPSSADRDEGLPTVVRYVPVVGGDWSDELAETADDFRDAIN